MAAHGDVVFSEFVAFLSNHLESGQTVLSLFRKFLSIWKEIPEMSPRDLLHLFKVTLKQWAIPYADEKKLLSFLSRYLPRIFHQGNGTQSSISRNASVRLAAAMWARALEEVGPMIAFLQSETGGMTNSSSDTFVVTKMEKSTKVTMTLSNPLTGLSEMVITVVVYNERAPWMKGLVQVICDAYFDDTQYHQLTSELVRIGSQQLGSCILATTAHGNLKFLVPSDSADATPAAGERVTFWLDNPHEVTFSKTKIGTIHTVQKTNAVGSQAKPDVLAQLLRANIQTMSEEEVLSLLTGIKDFIHQVLGKES